MSKIETPNQESQQLLTFTAAYVGLLVLIASAVLYCGRRWGEKPPAGKKGDHIFKLMLISAFLGWIMVDVLAQLTNVDTQASPAIRRLLQVVSAIVFFIAPLPCWRIVRPLAMVLFLGLAASALITYVVWGNAPFAGLVEMIERSI